MTHLGFDIGGTHARARLFDGEFSSLAASRRTIRTDTAPESVAEVMVELTEQICADTAVSPSEITSAGIGLAAQLSADANTVRNAPNLGWRDIEFGGVFASAFDEAFETTPSVRLVNDLTAQLWGERLDGAVSGLDDVLAVFVGTGIGGAILADGQLVGGAGNNAGEIGHSKVVVGGRPCGCGENGCVEAYAGGIHLERQLLEMIDDTNDDELAELQRAEHILSAADQMVERRHDVGDLWEQATDFLSLVIANAITLLNPQALLIGGGVFEHCHNFRAMTLQKTAPIVLEVARDFSIERADPAGDAGVLGAAALARQMDTESQ